MSSISSLLSQYFQLPTASSATTDGSGADTATTASTAMPSLADALAQAQSNNSNTDSDSNSAFTLDLSPDAQNYLQQMSSGNGSSAQAGNGFLLSPQQQRTLNSILQKYQDAPFDQATYDSIQNDLQAAGLAPQQLAAQDQMRQFNPVTELVDALSGKSSGLNPMDFGSSTDENANANSYMQMVVNQWQGMSATSGSANDTTTGGGAADSTSGGSSAA
ncbi:MAG: hypothetical protein WDN72_03805 [Alphaproteobacteria bacterium]